MSGMKTRSRTLGYKIGGGGYAETSADLFPPFLVTHGQASSPPTTILGTQITESEGHPFSHHQGENIGDVGGDFYTVRQYVTDAKSAVLYEESYINNGIRYTTSYNGHPQPVAPNPSLFPPIHDFIDHHDSMDEVGAKAVALVKPTNSIADLSTALGELFTEGLPKLPGIVAGQERTRIAKKAGSEYLGIQFGWLPFVGDIKDVARGISDADRIIAQYVRDSGKLVRRSIEFPVHEAFESETIATHVRPDFGQITSHLLDSLPYGDVICDRKTTTREKFSGGFTYHLPANFGGFDGQSKSALYAKKILGLDLSPDTVWNLTPWSWAADWFSNTGDVISNLSDYAIDGLCLRYGYIQRHIVTSYSYRNTGYPDIPPIIYVTEHKLRRRANPFGFGIQWDGLTPRQIAISVALGIKRVL